MSEAQEATRGSGIRLATEAVGRALSVVTTILIAAGLGVRDFGTYAALSGMAVILAELGDLGLQGLAVPALVARRFRLAEMVRAKLVLSVGLALVAGVLPLLASITSQGAHLLPDALGPTLDAAARGGAVLLPLVLYFGLAGWSEFLGVALRSAGRRGEEAAVILCLRAAGLVASILALRAGSGVVGLAWAQALSVLPPIAVGSALLARLPGSQSLAGPVAGIRQVLRAAAPLAVNGGLALLSLRIELLAIFFLKGSYEAGLFGAALKLVESLNAIPAALVSGALPALTREALSESRREDVRRRTAVLVAFLAVPAALGMGLLAPGVLRLLGAGFENAAPALRVLSMAIAVLFTNTLLLHALIAVGRAEKLPRLTAVRVGCAAVLALVLVPALGGVGAAVGFLVSELVLSGLASRACDHAGFAVGVGRPLVVAVALSLPMAAAVGLLWGSDVTLSGLGARVFLGTLVYVLTLGAAWAWGRPVLRSLLEGRRG